MIGHYLKALGEDGKRRLSEKEIFLALENLMLSSVDLGYSSCPIGGFEKDKYKEILKLPRDCEPVVVCPVGISKDEPRKKFRFKDEDIFL